MSKLPFNNEAELEEFVFKNLDKYFSKDRIFIGDKKRIKTKMGKGTIPDAILLDIENSKVCLIENELIQHGVFEHIVKQIIRFVVAYQNEESKRKLINLFFDIIKTNKEHYIEIFKKYYSDIEELEIHEQLEKIFDDNPELYIFIDKIDTDLEDFCLILKNSIEIKAVEVFKFESDGKFVYAFNDEEYMFSREEIKPIKESKASERYRKIFHELIEKFKELKPGSTKRGTTSDSWLTIPIGTTGFHLEWLFRGREPEKKLCVALHFENENPEINHKVFNLYFEKKMEIDDLFEEPVNYEEKWYKGGDWSAIYISKQVETLNNFTNDKKLKKWALDSMLKLYNYYMKFIDVVKSIINEVKSF